jgi:hypothetical protein
MSGVSFREWLSESVERTRSKGIRGILQSGYYAYVGLLLSVATRYPLGTNVFSRDWDLLIVLDACRVDALREVSDEYDFIGVVDSIRSVGSTSIEWMALTFRERHIEEISNTAYVNSNPQFDKVFRQRLTPPHIAAAPFGPSMERYSVVEPGDFHSVDNVYEYGFDDDYGVVMARTVTDRTIATGRRGEHDRCIVHYMQPHAPYIGNEEPVEHIFDDLREGSVSQDEAWEVYLENLRAVLNDIELLLKNYDANRVAITADHGEAFGEWTFYSHNIGCPHPAVRRVPWVETTATDEMSYMPAIEPRRNVSGDVEELLDRLGYR